MRVRYIGSGLLFSNPVSADKKKWVGIPKGSTGTVDLEGHSLSEAQTQGTPQNAVSVTFDSAIIAPRTSAEPKAVKAFVPFSDIEAIPA